jgi:predicted DNA-binding ribbon-helix-helix protein
VGKPNLGGLSADTFRQAAAAPEKPEPAVDTRERIRTSITLDAAVFDEMKRMAAGKRRPLNDLFTEAVAEYLASKGR